ncbi:DEKNAAC103016 [Brettanomyces naardenensis]|uniref:Protein-serine/threonine kinase n=1 Tax=Brettanomyces naardenensis TaxID=13370 RepID=A0A448YMC8_BRENA|nr:DEKNAAC103016 [Brettanomyces naardenensis]
MSYPPLKLSAFASKLESMLPFQARYANLLNEQHFYQNDTITSWASKEAHPVTLRQLANYGQKLNKGKIIASANFVRNELPIRLSLRVKEMQELKFNITNNYHLNQVYQSYWYCFNAFRHTRKIITLEDNDKFCRFLSNVLDDHLIVLPHLLMGTLEVSILRSMPQKELDSFISSMIRSRISRRVIMEQHISLSNAFQSQSSSVVVEPANYIGAAFENGSAHERLKVTAEAVKSYIQSNFPNLKMPELIIEGDDVKFEFLTAHLNYIFAEIFRNAFKATINNMLKHNGHLSEEELSQLQPPPVIVQVSTTENSTAFKFSDQGGGMSNERLSKVWSFGKSPELATLYLQNFHKMPGLDLPKRLPILDHQYWDKPDNGQHAKHELGGVLGNLGNMESSPQRSTLFSLAGRSFQSTLGLSLPMCKVYTDYWGGTLEMYSVEGYGSDVYLTFGKIGTNQDSLRLDRA